jgi:hypothetical protein
MVFGGAEGDRTPDLVIANDALSQLSYCPTAGGCLADWPEIVKRAAGNGQGSGCGVLAHEGHDLGGRAGPGEAGEFATVAI